MVTRRDMLLSTAAGIVGGSMLMEGRAQHVHTSPTPASTDPLPPARAVNPDARVVTLDGWSLPYRMDSGVKVFHLIAGQYEQQFTEGLDVKVWGYNGSTPGPTIEAFEGDRIRILVENRLPEGTSVHWHGVILPNGMDGVSGLTQPKIGPGETWAYEFTLKQSGTLMYHPHFDEMVQIAMGMMGFLIIHPRSERTRPRVDRDFAIFVHEWFIKPGTSVPDPMVMLDFNTFTFNGKVFPSTQHMIVGRNDRVRIRMGNLTMDSHPLHIHGHKMWVTGTDAGPIPQTAWWPENSVNIPVGTTRDVEFVADNPGDWAFHCHKSHHTMNQMGHDIPNMIGVDTRGVDARIRQEVPAGMLMGDKGMGGMPEHMTNVPRNSIPMKSGMGPFGPIEMGGMFTIIKVREGLTSYEDPGWYRHPEGTVAWKIS